MRKLLLLLMIFANVAFADQPSAARQATLRNMLKHDCGACHGMTLKGGLGPSLLPEAIKDKDDEFLVNTILNGRKDTAMPPWAKFISPAEARWLIKQIRQIQ